MKKYGIFLWLLLSVLPLCGGAQSLPARIKLDTDRSIGQIDTLIYSNFTEHLSSCIYGGLYDPGSRFSDKDGMRKDVIAAVKQLQVPLVRWPGGNFASGYHWQDGIGPKDKRPVRMDLAWHKRESNAFGTDEFMEWCRKVGTQPYLCVNLATGSLDEAHDWVEYCNIDKGTYFSDLRRSYGHEQPYHVKYWGLGNEVDGPWQIGHMSAVDYAKKALEAAKLMKWTDKSIKLIASGSSNYGADADWINWNRTLLDYLKGEIDYISLHNYVNNAANDYYAYMAATRFAEQTVVITQGLIREAMTKVHRRTPIYIAYDEYNASWRNRTFNLEDALVVATYLNIFVRHADVVKMANMAQLVNLLAPIMAEKGGVWLQTIYYPLALFSHHCYGRSLEAYVDCPSYSLKSKELVPYLDVSASYDKAKSRVVLNVVNRCKEEAVDAGIECQSGQWNGDGQAYTVDSKNVTDANSLGHEVVKTVEKGFKAEGAMLHYSFPPHSFTQLLIPIKK